MGQTAGTAPEPGPLGWLEFTCRVVRDRSHTAWAWLSDEDLLAAVHQRGGVAAYLPGEQIGTRDQVLLRLAVDTDGRVALARPGEPPAPGPQLEEFVVGILEELRTLALIDHETAVGPPGLPHEQLRHDAEQPDPDTRQVYAWKAQDATVGRLVASLLKQPVDLHRDGDWIVAAVAHQSPLILPDTPGRGPVGVYPFLSLDRRGELRSFTYREGARAKHQRIHVEWGPGLQAAPPPQAHPDTVALARWLADPDEKRGLEATAGSRVADPTAEQTATVERVIASDDGSTALADLCAAYGIPVLAARLVEVPHGAPDPVEPWQRVEPGSRASAVGQALVDANAEEPTGSMPWHALERSIYHRPQLGLVLGFIELLLAGGLMTAILNGALSPWWWIAVGALLLVGIEQSASGILRRRALRSRPGPDADPPR